MNRLSGFLKISSRHLLVFILVSLAACTQLRPDFEEPGVKVVSLRALPAEGMEQKFAIGLRITNPNTFALNLVGMSYHLKIQGYDLLDGVANDIPEIPAFADIPLQVTASVNMLNSLRFIRTLLSEPQDRIEYELGVKLALNSRLFPTLHLAEKGEISLTR